MTACRDSREQLRLSVADSSIAWMRWSPIEPYSRTRPGAAIRAATSSPRSRCSRRALFDEDRSVVDLLDREPHVRQRARRAALRHQEREGRPASSASSSTDSVRWGLLGKGAVLMAAAYPNRTSPVLRGAFILEASLRHAARSAARRRAGTCRARRANCFDFSNRSRADGGAQHGPRLLLVPRRYGSARLRAREFRRRRRVARARSLRRHVAARHHGQAAGRHGARRPGRSAQALLRRPEQFVQTFTEGLFTYALGRNSTTGTCRPSAGSCARRSATTIDSRRSLRRSYLSEQFQCGVCLKA